MKTKKMFILEIIIIGLLIFLVSHFLLQICFVNGPSMEPTLKNGQMLFAKKINLKPKKNDIAVIKCNKKIIIKRIIGTPNDRIIIKNGNVYVNNIQFDDKKIENAGNAQEEIVLKDNQFFVLGDNRQQSIDSRFDEIGIINKDNIIGIII